MSRERIGDCLNSNSGRDLLREIAQPFEVHVTDRIGMVAVRSPFEASYEMHVRQRDVGRAIVRLSQASLEAADVPVAFDIIREEMRNASRNIRGHLIAKWLRDPVVGSPVLEFAAETEMLEAAAAVAMLLLRLTRGKPELAERVSLHLMERVERLHHR